MRVKVLACGNRVCPIAVCFAVVERRRGKKCSREIRAWALCDTMGSLRMKLWTSSPYVCNDVHLAYFSCILEVHVKRWAYWFFTVNRQSLNQLSFAQKGAASSQTFALWPLHSHFSLSLALTPIYVVSGITGDHPLTLFINGCFLSDTSGLWVMSLWVLWAHPENTLGFLATRWLHVY